MKTVYLDKKEHVRLGLTSPRMAIAGALAALVLFVPVWHETRAGRFNLEPLERATIRASVAGEVIAVLPEEAQFVSAGSPLIRLRNLELEGRAARVASDLQLASVRATQARLRYVDYSKAERERDSLQQQSTELALQLAALQPKSPISGVVVTPRVRDLTGAYVQAGALLVEVADVRRLRARIYVPEFDLREVLSGEGVSLKMDSLFQERSSQVEAMAPVASGIEPGLASSEGYKGMTGVDFYAVTTLVPNEDGLLKPGMSGTAKILIARRSLAGFAWKMVRDFVDRKIW